MTLFYFELNSFEFLGVFGYVEVAVGESVWKFRVPVGSFFRKKGDDFNKTDHNWNHTLKSLKIFRKMKLTSRHQKVPIGHKWL